MNIIRINFYKMILRLWQLREFYKVQNSKYWIMKKKLLIFIRMWNNITNCYKFCKIRILLKKNFNNCNRKWSNYTYYRNEFISIIKKSLWKFGALNFRIINDLSIMWYMKIKEEKFKILWFQLKFHLIGSAIFIRNMIELISVIDFLKITSYIKQLH